MKLARQHRPTLKGGNERTAVLGPGGFPSRWRFPDPVRVGEVCKPGVGGIESSGRLHAVPSKLGDAEIRVEPLHLSIEHAQARNAR